MNLAELQTTFQHYLMDDTSDPSTLTNISPIAQGNVAERLNIYHHAYRSRIREAMSNHYPNLKKLLGCPSFNQYVDGFIAQHPSHYKNMRWLGGLFGDYLFKAAPENLNYRDMAHFEWQLGLAFDSADSASITLQDLSQIAPEDWGALTFKWHPSVYVGKAETNVIEVWMALEKNIETDMTVTSASLNYLIWRKNLVSHFKSIDETEARAIAFIMQNQSFGALCEFLATDLADDQALETAAGLLSDWLQQEMLIGLNIINESMNDEPIN